MTTYTAAAAIAAYQSGTTGTFDIVDTEADVAANLTGLETIAGFVNTNTLTLTLTDPSDPITLSYATYFNDRYALRVSGTYSLIVTGIAASNADFVVSSHVISAQFSDSAANVLTNLGSLENLSIFGEPYSITLTDAGPVVFNLTGSQWSGQKAVFGNIQGNFSVDIAGTDAYAAATAVSDSYVASISVSDTANGVRNELDALGTLASQGKLTSITLTDGSTNALPVTAAQLSSDAGAISVLTGPYSLAISGATVADASALAAMSHVTSVAISDTGANIGAGLDSLETLAKTDPSLSISISDYQPLRVTEAQVTADADALADFTYYLLFLRTTAAAAPTEAYQTRVAAIDISDTAANVAANLDAIQTLQSALKLDSITLTDSGTPTLTITDAQLSRDDFALAYISSPYNLALTGVDSSSAASRLLDPHVTSVAVVDWAVDVPYSLDSFQSMLNAGKLTGISLYDSGTPQITITATQLTADAGALNLISSSYNLTVSGVTVANAATTEAAAHVTSVTIADTAADISAGLDSLQSMVAAGKVTGISVTDNGVLSLSQAQMSADSQAIGVLTGSYGLTLQGVSAASATGSVSLNHVRSVSVLDSAANVAAHLDSLETLALDGELTGITLTDSGTPTLTISQTQYNNDTLALQEISGSYKVATNSVSVSQFHTLSEAGQVTAVSISDSAANVAAGLDELQAGVSAGAVTSIAVTDAGIPNLAISYTQMSADALALQDIVGSHTLTVSGVSVANLSTVLGTSGVLSAGVADSAANIGADLDGLQSLLTSGKLISLAVTDDGTLSATAAQMVSDAQAINDIAGAYTLVVTNASISSLSSSAVAHASEISVSDSAANISSDLDTLQSYAAAGKLTAVKVTDTAFDPISVTSAQLTSDAKTLSELSGNFTIAINASGANLALSGVSGHGNTVSFADAASDYAISVATSGDTVTVTDTGTGRTSTDTLSGVTAVQFASQTDIVAQTPGQGLVTTGNVTELYGAVFGRLPDVAGLQFYENVLAQAPNTPLTTFAQWFLASPEYTSNSAHDYAQSSAGDAQFITDCYTNLLGRAPETGAIPYYENVINSFTQGMTPGTAAYAAAQTLGHAYVLSYFSASPEFLGDVTVTAQNPSSTQHWLLLTNG